MNIFGQNSIQYVQLDYSKTPFEIYESISENYDRSFLFESLEGPGEIAETTVMGFDPDATVLIYADCMVITDRDGKSKTHQTDDPFSYIRGMLKGNKDMQYRYAGGAVGTVNYDAVSMWEKVAGGGADKKPLMEFGIYTDGILYDHIKKKSFYFYRGHDRYERLKTGGRIGEFSSTAPSQMTDKGRFSEMIKSAKKYVLDGDVFQVVLSRKYVFDAKGDPLKVYAHMRKLNPSPYMYHVKAGEQTTIGASPEMLLRVTGKKVETFPIAGTRKIAESEQENERLTEEMIHSEKELAEHTMLVDLGRNDVGRVCSPGSVRVEDLMKVKRFSHVQHMVSHVSGKLDAGLDMFDAFRAIFPAGTVSGAPKVRAMEIIDELESSPRGPYAGAVGYFSFNGCCDFAIAIRSIFFDGQKGFVQAGAGIVYDSDDAAEFDETVHKAGAMLESLESASK